MRAKRSELFVALLLGGLAWLYWRIGVVATATDEFNFVQSGDLWLLYQPLLEYGFERLRSLDLPLWNPWQGLGMPFLASGLVGLFYPLNALYLALPIEAAISWSAVLHLALSGLFTWLFLHHGLKLGSTTSLFGAIAFQLSGAVTREVLWPSILEAMIWLPLELFFLERLLRGARARWALGLAVALGFQILSGGVFLVVHSMYTLAAWSLFRLGGLALHGAGPRALASRVGLGLVAGVLALALSAIQWVPTMELVPRTVRGFGGLRLSDAEPLQEFMTPLTLLRGLLDLEWGAPSVYVGILVLILAPWGITYAPRRPQVLFFAAWAALTFILACGSHTPLFTLFFHHVPTGDWFRVPARFLWLTTFSLAVLASLGLEGLLQWTVVWRSKARHVSLMAVGLLAIELLVVNQLVAYPYPDQRPDLLTARDEQFRRLARHAREGRIWIRGSLRQSPTLPAKIGTRLDIPVLNDYEPMSVRRWRDLAAAVAGEEAVVEDPFFVGELRARDRRMLRLLQLVGVTLVVEPPPSRVWSKNPPRGTRALPPDEDLALVAVESAQPLAFLVGQVLVIPDRNERLAVLGNPEFDFRRVAVVEQPVELTSPGPRQGEVLVERESPEIIHLRTRVDAPSLVVLTELYYPGWRAWVDGRPAELLRVDHAFRGVLLQAGNHHVELRYRPVSFALGLGLTCLAVFVLGFGLATSLRVRSPSSCLAGRRRHSGLEETLKEPE